MATEIKKLGLDKALPYILAIGGIVGLLAAFILTIEKIELIKDPSFQPSCNISPILSCGSVMGTTQAEAFSVPNSLIGIAGFAVLAALGVAMLAGARYKRWLWLCIQAGMVFGMGFVLWLQYHSIYVIGALCPYCMVVWAVMIPIFWYVTLYNLRQRHIRLPARLQPANEFVQRHHGDIIISWFVILVGLILHRFWSYWSTLL